MEAACQRAVCLPCCKFHLSLSYSGHVAHFGLTEALQRLTYLRCRSCGNPADSCCYGVDTIRRTYRTHLPTLHSFAIVQTQKLRTAAPGSFHAQFGFRRLRTGAEPVGSVMRW